MRLILVFVLAVGSLAIAPASHAQEFGGKGLYVNPFLSMSAWKMTDAGLDTESGGGAGFGLGLGITQRISVFADVTTARISSLRDAEKYSLSHGDAGVRVTLTNLDNPFQVYASGSLTARIGSVDVSGVEIDAKGSGITAGAGVRFFMGAAAAVDVGVRYTFATVDEVSRGMSPSLTNVDSDSNRVLLGLVWFPFR